MVSSSAVRKIRALHRESLEVDLSNLEGSEEVRAFLAVCWVKEGASR